MVKQYDGILGVFEYDDEEYEIDKNDGYLRYIKHVPFKYIKPQQPIGCINFNFLFNGRLNIEIIDLSFWTFNDDINIEHMFDGLNSSDIGIIINDSLFNEDNDKLQEQFNSLTNIKLFLINSKRSRIIEFASNDIPNIAMYINAVESSNSLDKNHLNPCIDMSHFEGDTLNIIRTPSINNYYGDQGEFFNASNARDLRLIKGSGSGYKRPRKNQKKYF